MDVKISAGWKKALSNEFKKDYFLGIVELLKNEIESKQVIYPPGPFIFNAFNTTVLKDVKVVIIGQDPYHGPNQAHGLSFSVQKGIKPPPSLVNIYKEIEADLGIKMPRHYGDLSQWAKQGVLLLNASLTVRANQPNSHAGIGWQIFTDAVINLLNTEKKNIVFLLWGNFAKEKGAHIDEGRHLVLKAMHPSPFAADKGFLDVAIFQRQMNTLSKTGLIPLIGQL